MIDSFITFIIYHILFPFQNHATHPHHTYTHTHTPQQLIFLYYKNIDFRSSILIMFLQYHYSFIYKGYPFNTQKKTHREHA